MKILQFGGGLDMQLMTHCKYFVLPHSSFSWWGGYLPERPGKIMIVPWGVWPGTKYL